MAGTVVTDNGANVRPAGGALTPAQVRGIAYQAGFRGAALNTAVQIAGAESSYIPTNRYAPGPQEDSRGLWQINIAPTANPGYATANLYNPLVNAKIAFAMSHGGTNWSPWTTYTSGKYLSQPTGGGGSGVLPGPSGQAPGMSTPNAQKIALPATPAQPAGPNKGLILGNYLKEVGSSQNPFNQGLGGPKGSSAIGGQSILGTGLLAGISQPTPAHYAAAQSALQQLAGGQLKQHPAVTAATSKSTGYLDPFSGWSIGRTDQGVDVNAPKPGTPLPAIGDSKVIGILPNWYNGQPYIWLQLLNGPHAGQYYYYAEQITGLVKPGQVLRKGQPVAYYAPSGTGVEAGWATANGSTLARATTGYTEGQVTPAGLSFRNFLGL